MHATILTIAGSDPTGGEGLQADIKTLNTIGVYAAAVVTCITVQNSRGVTKVEPLQPELVREQINAVLEDHPVAEAWPEQLGRGLVDLTQRLAVGVLERELGGLVAELGLNVNTLREIEVNPGPKANQTIASTA